MRGGNGETLQRAEWRNKYCPFTSDVNGESRPLGPGMSSMSNVWFEFVAVKLANQFSTILREWLTEEEWRKVLYLNSTDVDAVAGKVCHTHDFCDANQAMIDAMEAVGIPFEPGEQEFVDMMNASWDLAKLTLFQPTARMVTGWEIR